MKLTLKKELTITCIIVLLFTCLGFYINTESMVMYVDQSNGSDKNTGTSIHSAFSTLERAIEMINTQKHTLKTSKIILCSDYVIDTYTEYVEPKHDALIEISSADDCILYLKNEAVYSLGGATVFKDINIYTEGNVHFAANFNSITFDMGVVMKSNSTSNVSLYGGYKEYSDNLATDKDSHITIKSGDFSLIVGFTYQKGSSTATFEGTSYINIYGGNVSKIYCASADNHYSGSTVFSMYGGNVGTLCSGGSTTRRLNGSASIRVFGGSISKLNINNVIEDITLILDGGQIDSAQLSYANTPIQNAASNSKISITYDTELFADVVELFSRSARKYSRQITLLPKQSDDTSDTESISETIFHTHTTKYEEMPEAAEGEPSTVTDIILQASDTISDSSYTKDSLAVTVDSTKSEHPTFTESTTNNTTHTTNSITSYINDVSNNYTENSSIDLIIPVSVAFLVCLGIVAVIILQKANRHK